jgi:hypothetical protein
MSGIIGALRISNPHHEGSPARMADGRLFTDYRPNCKLLPIKKQAGPFAEFDLHSKMYQNAEGQRNTDRMLTVMRAANTVCVDTMVPELTKRVYTWAGPQERPAQPVGIGTGRLYLPGRPDLAGADPDVVAAATFPEMPGTFSPSPAAYIVGGRIPAEKRATAQLPVTYNRYAAPYGN